MIATRSQVRSTSERMWLDMKIVRPSCLGLADDAEELLLDQRVQARTSARRACSRSGRCWSATTRPTFCLLPFEYSLNFRLGSTSRRVDQLGLVGLVDVAAQVREVVDRLPAGQLVVERELARQVAQAPMDGDRIGGRVDAEHRRPPARRADVVEQGADRRRLAGAVRAEEAEGLALVDGQVDVDDAPVRAVGLRQLLGLDHRGHAVTSFPVTDAPGGGIGLGLRSA